MIAVSTPFPSNLDFHYFGLAEIAKKKFITYHRDDILVVVNSSWGIVRAASGHFRRGGRWFGRKTPSAGPNVQTALFSPTQPIHVAGHRRDGDWATVAGR